MSPKYSLQAKTVLDYLESNCRGRLNARPIREIAAALCMDRREFEKSVEDLRAAGQPVCSSCAKPMGLFIARNYAEAEEYVRQIDHRFRAMAVNRAKAVETLKAIAKEEGIQMSMELEGAVV